MSGLAIRFRHRFPTLAVDIDLQAPTPGTTVLFGASGSGKSTIVNVLSGLLQPAACRIALDGRMLCDTEAGIRVATERRRIGVVFQDARLFPHLSVLGNLRYGMRRAPSGPIALDAVLDLLGIGDLLARRPHTLSGGERARVAIGRALLSQPRLLAMDEPLASLDAPRKAEILPYLARLKTTLSLPILYVTHALDEVAALADTLALVDQGRVSACGPVTELCASVAVSLAARDDAAAVLEAELRGHDVARRLTRLRAGGVDLLVPLLAVAVGETLRIRVPAREVALARVAPEAISVHNVLPGQVREVVSDSDAQTSLVEVAVEGAVLLARVTRDAVDTLALMRGAPVFALVKSTAVIVLNAGPVPHSFLNKP